MNVEIEWIPLWSKTLILFMEFSYFLMITYSYLWLILSMINLLLIYHY